MSREPPDPVYILRGSNSPVTSLLHYSASNSTTEGNIHNFQDGSVLSGTQDGKLRLWDLTTWRPLATEEAHSDSLLSIRVKPSNHRTILTQGRDSWIHSWQTDGASFTKTGSLKTPNPAFCQVDYTTVGGEDVVALPTENEPVVNLVSLDTRQQVLCFKPKAGVAKRGMSMHIKVVSQPGGPQYLLVGYEDGGIAIWDFRAVKELHYMKFHEEALMAFDYNIGANRGLSASVDNKLFAWTLSEAQQFVRFKDIELTNPGVGCVRFRPDGKLALVGGWDGRLRIYSAKKLNPLVVLEQHKETVQCAHFSPDGTLFVGSKDKHISIWSLYR